MSACDCLRSVPLGALIAAIRQRCRDQAEQATIRVGDAVLDVGDRCLWWRGRRVVLTIREVEVLTALAGAHPAGLTGADLGSLVWGEDRDDGVRLARSYVRFLRVKAPGLIPYAPVQGHRYRIAPAEGKGAVA